MRKTIGFLAIAAVLLAAACSQDSETKLVSGVHLNALDRSTRPQDDFYQFVNGGWLDNTEIPEIYSGYTVYHEVRETVELALQTIINSAADAPGENGSESQQVGDIYSAWMDVDTINAIGIDPVLVELADLAEVDSVNSLVHFMARLFRSGVEVPYVAQIYPDLQDSSRYTVYIHQSGLTMPNRDYYLQADNENFAEAREKLAPYIASMLVRSGMEEADAQAASLAVYALETAIATVQWNSVRNRDPKEIYNPYPVDTLSIAKNRLWSSSQVSSRRWTG